MTIQQAILADFKATTFGTWRGPAGIAVPLAGGSVSGWVFIASGVLTAASFGSAIFPLMGSSGVMALICALIEFLLLVGGAWGGCLLHIAAGRWLFGNTHTGLSRDPAAYQIVPCRCGHKLRLPRTQKLLRVTCPKCREKFQIGDGSATDSSSTLKPKTRGFAWVWIVCLAVLGTLLLVSLLGSLKEYAQQSLNGMFTESFDKATSSSQKGNTPAAP